MANGSRIRHILAANVSHMLDRVEDPVKMLRALLREMDEASAEARGTMDSLKTELKTLTEELETDRRRAANLTAEAGVAVASQNEAEARDLLRERIDMEALVNQKEKSLGSVANALDDLQRDINRLAERRKTALERLQKSRGKQQDVVRHTRYATRARERILATDETFERLEARIDRMQAEAESFSYGLANPKVEATIDAQMAVLKKRVSG